MAEKLHRRCAAIARGDEADALLDSGHSPAYRWVERMLNLIETRGLSNPKNARNMALLNVAIYDATIAAWESKNAYNRQRPAIADRKYSHGHRDSAKPFIPVRTRNGSGSRVNNSRLSLPRRCGDFRHPARRPLVRL